MVFTLAKTQNTRNVTMYFFENQSLSKQVLANLSLKVDSMLVNRTVNHQLLNLYELGYLLATYEIRFTDKQNVDVHFFTNQVFKIIELDQGNVDDEILNKIRFDARQFFRKPFSHNKIVDLLRNVLDYAEGHGYPFASINLDSINIINKQISAWLNYQSGPLILFDSLSISGYDKIKTKYLMTHLGIYPNSPFDEKLIQEIPNRIKLLPFLSLVEKPAIEIKNGKCNIKVTLAQNKISKLDGILGILPNENSDKSLLITGQINLDLYNLFSSGKRIAIEWQSFDASSQLLDAVYFHPNLFRTPINIQGEFNLLKQDSTFINREFGLEFSLITKNSKKIGFTSEFNSSRLISTNGLEDISELPENADYNINYYGLKYLIERFDNPNLPTSGWAINIIGSIGQKKIIENPGISNEIYKGVNLKSLQVRISAEVDKYWNIKKSLLLRTRLQGGYLDGKNLFRSDLFRVGGLRSLRGFVENHFYSQSYGIGNFEFRSMFSSDTYFFAFFDQAVVKENTANQEKFEYPFGTGLGFSFSTNAGVFNFVFAMGKSENQPFGLEYSKIHFGYIGLF